VKVIVRVGMVGGAWIGQVVTERGRVLAQSNPLGDGDAAHGRALEMAMVHGWQIVEPSGLEGLRVAS